MRQRSALALGIADGYLKGRRMHAGCCAIITTPMGADLICSGEKVRASPPFFETMTRSAIVILSSLDISFSRNATPAACSVRYPIDSASCT